jgi:hypothetical protein
MDAKDPRGLFANRTLWLDADSMQVARERFWHAYQATRPAEMPPLSEQTVWNIGWAAAIAAFSYMQEGNLGKPIEDEGVNG